AQSDCEAARLDVAEVANGVETQHDEAASNQPDTYGGLNLRPEKCDTHNNQEQSPADILEPLVPERVFCCAIRYGFLRLHINCSLRLNSLLSKLCSLCPSVRAPNQ